MWTLSTDLPQGRVEYKFVHASSTGELRWERGDNRLISIHLGRDGAPLRNGYAVRATWDGSAALDVLELPVLEDQADSAEGSAGPVDTVGVHLRDQATEASQSGVDAALGTALSCEPVGHVGGTEEVQGGAVEPGAIGEVAVAASEAAAPEAAELAQADTALEEMAAEEAKVSAAAVAAEPLTLAVQDAADNEAWAEATAPELQPPEEKAEQERDTQVAGFEAAAVGAELEQQAAVIGLAAAHTSVWSPGDVGGQCVAEQGAAGEPEAAASAPQTSGQALPGSPGVPDVSSALREAEEHLRTALVAAQAGSTAAPWGTGVASIKAQAARALRRLQRLTSVLESMPVRD
jgi:hypothetical protein